MADGVYSLYLELYNKHGEPGDLWKDWCKERKSAKDRETIAIGGILAQRTKWRNAEIALKNLAEKGILSIKEVYDTGKRNIGNLEILIRPSGFYKQKAKCLFLFSTLILKEHGSLADFFRKDPGICREQLLGISGIGPETADSILLYAGDIPFFVIDEYTRRLAEKRKLTDKFSYDHLQSLFQKNLPKDPKIYRDFHALIVSEGKITV